MMLSMSEQTSDYKSLGHFANKSSNVVQGASFCYNLCFLRLLVNFKNPRIDMEICVVIFKIAFLQEGHVTAAPIDELSRYQS